MLNKCKGKILIFPLLSVLLTSDMCVFHTPDNSEILQTPVGFPTIYPILTLLPGVSIRCHRLRTESQVTVPLQTPLGSSGCHVYFCPVGCKSEVPMNPSLGSINLLEQLT